MKFYTYANSPLGELLLVSDGENLCGLYMDKSEGKPHTIDVSTMCRKDTLPVFVETEKQLNQYFSKQRRSFQLPIKMSGTEFQKSVWQQLTFIEYGSTASYGDVARQIRNPSACRAVGLANGHNPISIVVPCHRVVGANGSLTGYGGGLRRKQFLLDLESQNN